MIGLGSREPGSAKPNAPALPSIHRRRGVTELLVRIRSMRVPNNALVFADSKTRWDLLPLFGNDGKCLLNSFAYGGRIRSVAPHQSAVLATRWEENESSDSDFGSTEPAGPRSAAGSRSNCRVSVRRCRPKLRRKVYYLAETSRLPVFRIGSKLCARRSVLIAWIASQEKRGWHHEPQGDVGADA